MSGSYAGFPYAGGAFAGASAPGAAPPSDVGTNLPTVVVLLDDGTGTFPYDITAYVEIGLDGGPVTIQRGRDDEYGDVQASTCSLILNNTDGRFTLGSTAIASPSPIYVDNQIRVTFAVGAVSSTRFTGFVQNWPVAWPGGGDKYAVAQITAVDRLARLARRVLGSIVEQEILADSPDAYYTLGEPAGATAAGDTSGNGRPPLTMVGTGTTVTFGTATGPSTDGLTAASFAGGRHLDSAPISMGSVATFECFFSTTSTSGDMLYASLGNIAPTPADARPIIGLTAGAVAGLSATLLSPLTYNDGAVHHAALTLNGTTASLYVDGVLVDSDSYTADAPEGVISVGRAFTGAIAHAVVFTSTLSAARIAAHSNAGLNGFAGESSEDRISRYASYGNISAADQVLEAGVLTSVPHVDITGTSPLDAISQVNAAEQGLVFVRGDGKLVLQNRHHRASQTSADWTLAAEDLQGDVSFTTDMQHVTNYVTASRVDGTIQTARNAASITKHEQYPTSYDNLLVSTDAEALDLANWLASTHAEPGARLPSVTIDLLSASTAFRQAWLGIELSARIRITGLPAQAPASSVDLIVEGWTETLSNSEWTTTLNTSPFSLVAGWILDDATYSVLGTTTLLAS